MRAAFIIRGAAALTLIASRALGLGGPIQVSAEGAIAVASTPDQYGGSMALPGSAQGGLATLQAGVAPSWRCSLNGAFFRLGPGGLAPGWGSIPENQYTTEPSNLLASLLCLRFEPVQERATLFAFGGAGVGRWHVGDERILSILQPYEWTVPGYTETVAAFAIGGGVHGHAGPIAPSATLQWILVSTKNGPVSIVPLSVGVSF